MEKIVLLDDPDLHCALISTLRTLGAREPSRAQIRSGAGAGFARGVQLQLPGATWHILCLGDHNSHPFSYLTLGAFATQRPVTSVLAITSAHSLREDLFPGDLTLVRRASALPYPALFSNKNPYENQPTNPENFDAKPESLSSFSEQLSNHSSVLWQRKIPQVHCGYARHPTLAGELMPWAPEQFAELRNQGLDTISSAAVGVYEAQKLMPDTNIVCLNQITSSPNADSNTQWKRYKTRFQAPIVQLVREMVVSANLQHSALKP